MYFAVIGAVLASASNLPNRRARPHQGMTAPVNDVVIIEFFLQLVYIINRNNHANALAVKHDKAVNQRLSGLVADVGYIPFEVFLYVPVGKAFNLIVCELHANGFFCFSSRNQNCQRLTSSRDLIIIC